MFCSASYLFFAVKAPNSFTLIFRGGDDLRKYYCSKNLDSVEELSRPFERRSSKEANAVESERKITELDKQIGRLTTHVSWLKKSGLNPGAP